MLILKRKNWTPLSLPVFFFIAVILLGTILLHAPFSQNGTSISWLDALFTATSATCVTGLSVFDVGSTFSLIGQGILLLLIQLGGLGIMTFTSLAAFLVRKKVSLRDKIAVGQILLHDSKFNLGTFLLKIVTITFTIELIGAVALMLAASHKFTFYTAIFHSISAFCNAGFALFSDSLMSFQGDWVVNLIFIILIITGGLGFVIILELREYFLRNKQRSPAVCWQARIVVRTSVALIFCGWGYIFIAEYLGGNVQSLADGLLLSLFQSVTCRTAGFASVDIGSMTNASLVFMMFLMFIGGGPGSCAGGIKVTTFRVLVGFVWSQLRGRKQVVIGKFAVDKESLNNSVRLVCFGFVIIFVSLIILDFTEGSSVSHAHARGQFLDILFEIVSAFGTAGLSTGLTSTLSPVGKMIITVLMFTGRLGPLFLLSSFHSSGKESLFKYPEEKLSIG